MPSKSGHSFPHTNSKHNLMMKNSLCWQLLFSQSELGNCPKIKLFTELFKNHFYFIFWRKEQGTQQISLNKRPDSNTKRLFDHLMI